eukprot:5274237-Pleurochrysis_carterae.AAC.1
MEAGYRLKVLSYFSKPFNSTQRNWATFDKEAASIRLAVTHWHRLVAYRKPQFTQTALLLLACSATTRYRDRHDWSDGELVWAPTYLTCALLIA